MKTLVGLYEVSTDFQKSNSSIAEVIPYLFIENEIFVLEKIDLPAVYKSLIKGYVLKN